MKKQFRLYDLYRFATIGAQSKIKGITSYECNTTATTIVVHFDSTGENILRFANDEKERKLIVTEINKKLNNCQKPGRK